MIYWKIIIRSCFWMMSKRYLKSFIAIEIFHQTCLVNTASANCLALRDAWPPGNCFIIKMSSYEYRKSCCGDKRVLQLYYLKSGISYTEKVVLVSLYRNRLQQARWWHKSRSRIGMDFAVLWSSPNRIELPHDMTIFLKELTKDTP